MGSGRGTGRVTTFAALADPTYRLLWLGGLVSFLAVQMEFIARGWLAYELTGSNGGLGAVFLGFGIPMLLLTPWGGVVADRLPKRLVLVGCQLTLGLSSAGIALAIALDVIEYWMLIAGAVLQGAGFSFLGPARMAFTGALVGRDRLANAIVLQQMSLNGTRIFGQSIGGALVGVALVGVGGVYFLTTALMLVAVTFTLRLPPGPPEAGRPVRSPVQELADGVSYVWSRPLLRLLAVTSFVVVMAAFPYIAFLPTIAEELFDVGSTGFGLMSGVSAVGALAATVLIANRADGPGAWRLQGVAGAVFALGVALLGVSPSFVVALVVLFVAGAASAGFQSVNSALVLSNSDRAYHGRVQSLMMLSFSGFGIAALPIGLLADAIGITTTLVGMGAVSMAAIAGYWVIRQRILARDPHADDPPAARGDEEADVATPAGAPGAPLAGSVTRSLRR